MSKRKQIKVTMTKPDHHAAQAELQPHKFKPSIFNFKAETSQTPLCLFVAMQICTCRTGNDTSQNLIRSLEMRSP